MLKAREHGYRSRVVFKLEEIQQKDRIFKTGQFMLDLGAAPGGWSEYAREFCADQGRLIAVDILPIEPIADTLIIEGDFTEQKVLDEILKDEISSWTAFGISGIYANLGKMDEAFHWLEYEPHHAWVPWMTVIPVGKPMYNDDRFNEFIKRWNLPAAKFF